MVVNHPGSLWGKHQLSAEGVSLWSIGTLRLWCRFVSQELWVASTHKTVEEFPGDVEFLEWSRWAPKKISSEIEVLPVLPDRAVVVKPDYPFRLMSGARARVYVRVPVWVRIQLPGKEPKLVCEIPSLQLSKTWFGEYDSGEHCYWISSSARREVLIEPERNELTVCPLQIINQAEEDLVVEKICYRVGTVGLFDSNGQLWASESRITYRGGELVSQIQTASVPPKEAPKAVAVSPPREIVRGGIGARTFRTLQSLGGIGARFIEDIT